MHAWCTGAVRWLSGPGDTGRALSLNGFLAGSVSYRCPSSSGIPAAAAPIPGGCIPFSRLRLYSGHRTGKAQTNGKYLTTEATDSRRDLASRKFVARALFFWLMDGRSHLSSLTLVQCIHPSRDRTCQATPLILGMHSNRLETKLVTEDQLRNKSPTTARLTHKEAPRGLRPTR